MERIEIPFNDAPDMSWLAEAKDLVRKGFFLSIESGGIDNQIITLLAIHAKLEKVHLRTWIKDECPIRFNWLERVA